MPSLNASMLSDIGCIRTVNQDRVFAKTASAGQNVYGLFCVADGMGGLTEGEYASSAVLEGLVQWWHDKLELLIGYTDFNEADINRELLALFHSINQKILMYSRENASMTGTTCSVLLIYNDNYYIIHTGDSRIYRIPARFDAKKRVFQLTEDHNLQTRQIQEGLLSLDEIENNPRKNELTSCLGVFENPTIFTSGGVIEKNAVFILCSDGLYTMVEEHEMAKMVSRSGSCQAAAGNLVQAAVKNGAPDNVSVVVVAYKT